MGKIAFVFPGQGAQKAGMGQDFYDNSEISRKIYDLASQLLQLDMKKLCFEENELLNLTEYTQPAMVTTSLAMFFHLQEQGIVPDMTAGLSLGEYAAIVAAGALKVEDGIVSVRKRGILMEGAVPQGQGSMMAVLAMDGEKIEEILAEIPFVQIANYNCPDQIVISGQVEALKIAKEKLLEAGAKKILPLKVSGPFHSELLKDAGEQLAEVFAEVEMNDLVIPYVSNVTADLVTDKTDIVPLLKKQVYSSVKWHQSVEKMIEAGVDTFIEIGSGKTLSAFIKKINRNVAVYNVEKIADVEILKQKLAEVKAC